MEGAPIEVTVLRRPYVLRNIGLGIAMAGCLASLVLSDPYRFIGLLTLGATGVFLAIMAGSGNLRVSGTLDAGGLRVGGRLLVARDAIRSGWIERGAEGVHVRVRRRFAADVRLEAADEDAARGLLERLGQAPEQAVGRFSSMSWQTVLLGSLLGQSSACAVFDWRIHLPVFLLTVLTTAVLFLGLGEEMAIGADGVLFSSPLRRTFVPFSDILAVGHHGRSTVVIRTRRTRYSRRLDQAAASAAIERIQSAIDSLTPEPEVVKRQLQREGDVPTWIAHLRTLASGASYRAGSLAREAVWRVLDDPKTSESDRAAAAVVLGAVATDDERVRLRETAARIVSPRVRVAVERVADPADDEALAEALAQVEAR